MSNFATHLIDESQAPDAALTVQQILTAAREGSALVAALNTALGGSTWQGGGDNHAHSNKAILDAITAAFTTAMEAKLVPISVPDDDNFVLDRSLGLGLYDHTIAAGQTDAPPPGRLFASTVDGLIYHRLADGSTRLLDNVTSEYGGDGHTHSNKTVLDAITAAFTTADETKLDGIESGATADQSGAEIVALINANLGSSSWQSSGSGSPIWGGITGTLANQTDLQAALDGKAASGHTHAELHAHANTAILDATSAAFTSTLLTKLNGIETGATADLTGSEIVSLINSALSGTTWQGGGDGHTHSNKATLDATTASFTSALLTKLNGIETGATADLTGSEIVTLINTVLGGSGWQTAVSQVATPTTTPAEGATNNSPVITLATATSGATVRYTTDGSLPSNNRGTVYTGPFVLSGTGAKNVRSIAYKSGSVASPIADAAYTVAAVGSLTLVTSANGSSYQASAQSGDLYVLWGDYTGGEPTDGWTKESNGTAEFFWRLATGNESGVIPGTDNDTTLSKVAVFRGADSSGFVLGSHNLTGTATTFAAVNSLNAGKEYWLLRGLSTADPAATNTTGWGGTSGQSAWVKSTVISGVTSYSDSMTHADGSGGTGKAFYILIPGAA